MDGRLLSGRQRRKTNAPKIISFDNSGHRVSTPAWHSNATNVARTDAIMKTIASMFINDQDVVSSIQPLNEYVLYLVPTMLITAFHLVLCLGLPDT